MQHASNSGAVPWQHAIHALVVEMVRRVERRSEGEGIRDEEIHDGQGSGNVQQRGFKKDLRKIGLALNGLLPRRARLEDLGAVDGWADLAWLLDLNQGYYNAAALASVCCLRDDDRPVHCWLGKPIKPKEGNERLEPL